MKMSTYESEEKTLKEKVAALEKELNETKEALAINLRRYELAMEFSEVVIFDYNIKTKKIQFQPADFEVFGMPGAFLNGAEEVINSGKIEERSKENLRSLYGKIDSGVPSASTVIYIKDLNGMERTVELKMINVFDQNGNPIYAVGIRKDITDMVQYRREKEYGELLLTELRFIYEADVTQDHVIRYDHQWANEMGMGSVTTLQGILQFMCDHHVAEQDKVLFLEKQSREYLMAAFKRGECIVSFEYRKWIENKGYRWFEVRINLVEDELTHHVNMRVYVLDINSKKKREKQNEAQRKWYELMISRTAVTYEINLTANMMSWGHEGLKEQFDVFPEEENYTENILPLMLKIIHPNDQKEMFSFLSRDNLLNNYGKGIANLEQEYRRSDNRGEYHWFRCAVQIFEDCNTGDVLCYAYVENINDEKKKVLDLSYKAQHDLMTGFYHKNAAKEAVNQLLSSEDGKEGIHIFFIIDLDHFKRANDQFGHAFGDEVITKVASKINNLFRKDDILGRIGGDEFMVLMKGVKNEKIAFLKAREICEGISQVYTKGNAAYKVTASIGIAIYEKHGKTYDELYRHSDQALYEAKEHGRNGFVMYRGDAQRGECD
ncbi:MAG: GGDEF domain-containing protein [Anaerovorax sp.]